jgi:predicted acetyltransferase
LDKAKELDLKRILVVCHTDTIASMHVIEKNGGKFENEVTPEAEKPISRYWIELR